MTPAEYDRFTRHLVGWAERTPEVIGLVALGSMANADRRDEWSDHDFWVITGGGAAAALRCDSAWLPDADRIVGHFRETEHGRSAVYDDGHLLEYAVFDDREIEVARANDYRVLVDDGTLQARMSAMAALTIREHAETDPDGSDRFGNFAVQMVIGLTRYGRGEALSANHLIRGWAVRSLLSVLALAADAEQGDILDNLDPHRRFETAMPELGAQLGAAVEMPIPDLAEVLVDVADDHVVGSVPSATKATVDALRVLIERVRRATS